MGFGAETNMELDISDVMDDKLERTMMDKILQDWEVEESSEMKEGVMVECPEVKGQCLVVGAEESMMNAS